MSILQDTYLTKWAEHGGIYPYNKDMVNPASIDLRLHNKWMDYNTKNTITSDVITLYPNTYINRLLKRPYMLMIVTHEYLNIDTNVAGSIHLKTTPTRKGLGQIIGDWVDPGYSGRLTLLLYAHKKITLYYKQPICQLGLHELQGIAEHSYKDTGHYMNQMNPSDGIAWDEK